MKRWIRWSGLGAFAAVAALLACFWLVLVDAMVERVIEKTGSRLVGARVDLESADVRLLPPGLTLHGLQVTNPDEPMRNVVQIKRIAMAIDAAPLLERKIHIDEMAAQGVRFDTERRTSGAMVERKSAEKKAKETGRGVQIPDLQIPDVQEVLSRETLHSLEMAKELQTRLDRDRLEWQERLAELPDQQKFNEYKVRLQKLKSGSGFADLLSGASEAAAVQKEVRVDLERLQKAQEDFKAASLSYRKSLGELKEAPGRDINRLVDKYGLSAQGLGNMSMLLFGDKIGSGVQQAIAWYERAQPILERHRVSSQKAEVVKPLRGKGVMVRFQEKTPQPDFLIRTIKASVALTAGEFDGVIRNVTPDQDILGAPLSFAFSADTMQGLGSLDLDGVFDRVRPGEARDQLTLQLRDYTVEDVDLAGGLELPVTLESALADLDLRVKLQERDLDAVLQTSLTAVSMTATPGKTIYQVLADAVAGINRAEINAVIDGTLDDYHVALQSDLDAVLKNALGKSLERQTAHFKEELHETVMSRVKGPMAETTTSYGSFTDIAGELRKRLEVGGSLL